MRERVSLFIRWKASIVRYTYYEAIEHKPYDLLNIYIYNNNNINSGTKVKYNLF